MSRLSDFARAVGKHLVHVSCVGRECNRINNREALADDLEKFLDGVAPP